MQMLNITYGLALSEAVLDVALEDDAVRLGEPEGFVHGLQRVRIGREAGEDVGVQRTSVNAGHCLKT